MPRKKIPPTTQSNVLIKSRRRCCICFGLNRDTSLKQGQIAHLDQDPTNNSEWNLAFICFNHHDQYDSKTRQSKNFTLEEVATFREELYRAISLAFSSEVQFGDARTSVDMVSGHYIRGGEFESAELIIERLTDGRYHVSGLALWGKTNEYGPNLGELDFIGEFADNKIIHSQSQPYNDKIYRAVFEFSGNSLTVTEENWLGLYGMNVNFCGDYEKAT